MKKITLLAFLLAGALCASAGILATTSKDQKMALRGNGIVPQPVKVQHQALRGAKAGVQSWDFEDASQFSQFTLIDADGDGYQWEYYDADLTAHSGTGLLNSASYVNNVGALTPDNWVVSPEVELGGTLSFWACGQDADWAGEVFGVFVCVNGNPTDPYAFDQVGADVTATGTYVKYEFDLSAYAGQTGYFAIRHYNITDMFSLNIDDITLDPSSEPSVPLVAPTNVLVEPAATTANVAWTSEEPAFNLRYRKYVEPTEPTGYLWDFEEEMAEDNSLPAGWTSIDADGDGYTWYHLNTEGSGTWQCHSGIGHLTSASYFSVALTPDNWLVSPKVTLTGQLSFWAAGQDASWAAEVFKVYVCTGDPTNVNDFVAISDDITAENPVKQYTFDLSAYEGQEGYVAIRHYNVTDMFRLNIDDVMIGEPTEDPEWILVEGVDNPYTIEGLTPETQYEVQVQAVRPEATKANQTSDWTESVVFTTLAEEQEEAVYYVVGFNKWNDLLEIGEEGVTVDVAAQNFDDPEDTAQEFKIKTFEATGAEIWYGGIDETGAGFFLLGEDLMGVNITLNDEGSNFRLYTPGNYTIKLVKEGVKNPVEGIKMIVTLNEATAIETINAEVKGDNNYYNLMGQKFNGSNLPAGIYIHNGKKVVIK